MKRAKCPKCGEDVIQLDGFDHYAELAHRRDGRFFNTFFFKAVMMAALYYVGHRANRYLRSGAIPWRYDVLAKSADIVAARHWGDSSITKWQIGQATAIAIAFMSIDNAYAVAFEEIHKEYDEQLKKA